MDSRKAKGIAADLAATGTETIAETTADNLPLLASAIHDAGFQGAASILADGVIGAVAPGALGLVFGYRMRRVERNLVTLINELSANRDIVNDRLDSLEAAVRAKYTNGSYRDAFLDSVVDENEPEKVSRNVNAFINCMAHSNAGDSFVLTLFDDLSRLNRLDIRILKLHYYNPITGHMIDDSFDRLIQEEGIYYGEYGTIREKLCRLGLLESKNEEKREKNLKAVQDAVSELLSQLDKKNPKIPKPPKLQRINSSDSYSITSLGRRYLELIRPVKETVSAQR